MQRRYLQEYRVARIPHRFADVLVIGSGVAGLSACLGAATRTQTETLLVAKDELAESNTSYAQGGVAAVLRPQINEDSIEGHIVDTLSVAAGLANKNAVRTTVEEGVRRVEELIDLGVKFDRDPGGELQFTREGGHSAPRILHRGDTTGSEIARGLLQGVADLPNVHALTRTFAIDLLLDDEGHCAGALLCRPGGQLECAWARTTILATGGAGRLYRETTNPSVATGDGIAMSFRAGAVLEDLEFLQFHPTTLYLAGTERFLITEAVRGEGGVLRDDAGQNFMKRFHELEDLAPRDVVSRSILTVMKERGENKVWLDLSGIGADRIRARFPRILEFCSRIGLDILEDPIPVRPSAHYAIGGVRTNLQGETSIEGLLAAGEVACTRLHGANRLGSNSILEGLVFGRRCGLLAAERADRIDLPRPFSTHSAGPHRKSADSMRVMNPGDLLRSLKSLMWYKVGVERDGDELRQALEQLGSWISYCLGAQFDSPAGWSLQNMMQSAYLIVASALDREESRGVHFRSDFPEIDDERWKRHSVISRADFD